MAHEMRSTLPYPSAPVPYAPVAHARARLTTRSRAPHAGTTGGDRVEPAAAPPTPPVPVVPPSPLRFEAVSRGRWRLCPEAAPAMRTTWSRAAALGTPRRTQKG